MNPFATLFPKRQRRCESRSECRVMYGRRRAALLLAALLAAAAIGPCVASAASAPVPAFAGRLSEHRPAEHGIWLPCAGVSDGVQPSNGVPRIVKPQRTPAKLRNLAAFKRWRSRCADQRPRRRMLLRAHPEKDEPG
jgi:hypothetical protein